MNFRSLFGTSMGHRVIFSFAFALLFPIAVMLIERKLLSKRKLGWLRVALLVAYSLAVIFLTLIGREASERTANLEPFWSYRLWSNVEYRWSILMNVFVFVPFGFMLPWAAKAKL